MIFITLLNIAIFQGIVVGTIILKSPFFRSKANNYLAYAIFILSLLLLDLVFEILEIYNTFPLLRIIDNIEWGFIFLVFVLLFTIHQGNHAIKDSKQIRWLFLPFYYSAIINIFNDLDKVAHLYTIPNTVNLVVEHLNFAQVFILALFVLLVLISALVVLKSIEDRQEKKWMSILWVFVSIISLSWVVAIFIGLFFGYDISSFMKFLALFATFLIHWTAYFGIFKYRLAKDKEGINTLLARRVSSNQKIPLKNIEISDEAKSNNAEVLTRDNPYFRELEILCKRHQIYRDSNLNREKVAEQLGISTGYLSQLVNTVTGKNFANYINHFRIEAVKEMILDPEFENYGFLTIGLESGFTSKTTFYKAFKKFTGMTPNTYKKVHG
ncbi:helix-turn-helix domain-containing protein [uncultured Croceitalea sp.]|uniref:helix-turn-helix domain-containing protein n=1 Tax=uncultured Croceitalea sp. TaxID=1798908 RepID=UPI0033061D3E